MTTDNQVAVINNSIEVFKTAPEILKTNQKRSQKAVAVAYDILKQWESAWAITNEDEKLIALAAVDERSNKFLVNCSTALKEEKESRAAITQLMDKFKSMFTEAENSIDKSKPGTVAEDVQIHRNAFAKVSADIAERKRKEAELIAAKSQEAIDIKANASIKIMELYNNHLTQKKADLNNSFNTITLDNFDEKKEKLSALKPNYSFTVLVNTSLTGYCKHHTEADAMAIAEVVLNEKHAELKPNYQAELTLHINDLIDKLPSKKNELLEEKRLADEATQLAEQNRIAEEKRQAEINKANAEEKERLEKQAEIERQAAKEKEDALKQQQELADQQRQQREKEEADKLAAEKAEADKKAEQEAEIKKQGEQTMAMFDKEASLADVATSDARKGYDITVTHQAGWVQIFTLWFENEGKSLLIDKIGNTKLDQMKNWAEKKAHKDGTKIESKFIIYKESFTAVNKK